MTTYKERDIANDSRFREVVQQMAGGYRTVGQMVYEVLREAIISGAFAPGEWLRQESLAATIGVSRIPVRTALLQLEAEGLVNFHPHRGAQIRSLSAEQIEEVYRLRILLQTYALRRSMAKMTPERLEKLRQLAAQLDEQPEGGEFLATRVEFYRELHDAKNNPVLGDIIQELSGMVGRYLLSFRVDPQSHVELVDLIAAGDEAGAESWMRTHLENVRAGINVLAYGEKEAEAAAEG